MSLEEQMKDWDALHEATKLSDKHPTLDYRKFDTDKLVLTLMGDTHMGSKFYDSDLHRRHLDWCYEEGSPIILMGDMIEAATRDSVGAGVYEQSEIINDQYEHALRLHKPLAEEGLLLGFHPGNHEFRVYKNTGFDIAKALARELKIPFFGWGKLHYYRVGDQGYTLYTTHGASGARLPHTKIKGVLDLANLADAEIYAMGHLHNLSHHIRNYYDINKKNKTVEEQQKHFILTGSYLNHWGNYGHMKGYEPTRKGAPKVKLHGDDHVIRVSM